MSVENSRQLENTRCKLKRLEERLAALASEPSNNSAAREATRHSLQKLANQLREEITRFEVHVSAGARSPAE